MGNDKLRQSATNVLCFIPDYFTSTLRHNLFLFKYCNKTIRQENRKLAALDATCHFAVSLFFMQYFLTQEDRC